MSALSVATPVVAKGATIVVMEQGGEVRTPRKGTNAFICMPDNPTTPGPDPMCMDRNATDWVHAWVSKTAPAQGKVGLMYMLAGGTDASNTDPHAQKPTASNHWIKTGPHIMVDGADPSFYATYPRSPKPDVSKPDVMWSGAPYEHLMAPVR